jgi:DNA repair protein RecO (recombination protein O)
MKSRAEFPHDFCIFIHFLAIFMNWTDRALVLSNRPHGETASILTVLSNEHGKVSGLVHGGQSKRHSATLQAGNLIQAEWKGRLDEQLGTFSCEMLEPYSAQALSSRPKLQQLNLTCTMISLCLTDRQHIEGVFGASLILFDMINEIRLWPEIYQKWEFGLLAQLGFGLDLSRCAATGQTGDLIYISPKTGRAVSRNAGEPYKKKLFPLPHYLLVDEVRPRNADLIIGFEISGHFLNHCVLQPIGKQLPDIRTGLIDRLK